MNFSLQIFVEQFERAGRKERGSDWMLNFQPTAMLEAMLHSKFQAISSRLFFHPFFHYFTMATTWHRLPIDSMGSLRSKSADTFILTQAPSVICVPVITFAWLAADHAWNSLCWNKYVNLHIFLPLLYIYGRLVYAAWMQIYFVRNAFRPLTKRTVMVEKNLSGNVSCFWTC